MNMADQQKKEINGERGTKAQSMRDELELHQ